MSYIQGGFFLRGISVFVRRRRDRCVYNLFERSNLSLFAVYKSNSPISNTIQSAKCECGFFIQRFKLLLNAKSDGVPAKLALYTPIELGNISISVDVFYLIHR